MSWAAFPYREIAERVCSEKELEVLRIAAGAPAFGERRIAEILGVSRSSVRDRWRNAIRKIQLDPAYHGARRPG